MLAATENVSSRQLRLFTRKPMNLTEALPAANALGGRFAGRVKSLAGKQKGERFPGTPAKPSPGLPSGRIEALRPNDPGRKGSKDRSASLGPGPLNHHYPPAQPGSASGHCSEQSASFAPARPNQSRPGKRFHSLLNRSASVWTAAAMAKRFAKPTEGKEAIQENELGERLRF